jgi:hypothetical protein
MKKKDLLIFLKELMPSGPDPAKPRAAYVRKNRPGKGPQPLGRVDSEVTLKPKWRHQSTNALR